LGATRERSERGGWPDRTRAGAVAGDRTLAQPTDQVSEPMCLESVGALVAMV
jgi:hypothetical protein